LATAFSPSFPDGVAPLASEIRTAGFTPGLWLAPFIVDPSSQLARQHPEWLLRSRFNRPVNAGYVWNRLNTALDITRPEALAYASEVVQTAVHTWGFPYLKLDFLYAAALPGNYYDPTRTRAQALRQGLQALRLAAGPQTFLLGCGCPLGPAIGLGCHVIGADVARIGNQPEWGQVLFRSEPDYPLQRRAERSDVPPCTAARLTILTACCCVRIPT
jgi:alpha-galactosidase